MASSSSMNNRECTGEGNLLAVVRVLQKTHRPSVVLSHCCVTIATVHAAPVGYLPPPGTPPAARKASVDPCGQHTLSEPRPFERRSLQVLTPTLTAHTDTYRHLTMI